MQIVGQTEAAYTSQVSDPVSISAASVFPKTINQLEMEAKETSTNLTKLYHSILTTSLDGSTSELTNTLVEVCKKEQEIKFQLMQLRKIHEELTSYNEQSKDVQNSFQYIQNGYLNVEQIVRKVNETVQMKQIEVIKSTIHSKLESTNTSKEVLTNEKEGPIHSE